MCILFLEKSKSCSVTIRASGGNYLICVVLDSYFRTSNGKFGDFFLEIFLSIKFDVNPLSLRSETWKTERSYLRNMMAI